MEAGRPVSKRESRSRVSNPGERVARAACRRRGWVGSGCGLEGGPAGRPGRSRAVEGRSWACASGGPERSGGFCLFRLGQTERFLSP